ncbi:hypothetical protein GHT06_001885 [Daphnia sinensis]|uniref:Uncharacterized protein n=1 Tax=Daphnia sinensis TaxID=1820382 RepID=A0AAD5KTX7_9CRUS|nr:hypothetical protein GHT06_001885 [Daphnia sinensis]
MVKFEYPSGQIFYAYQDAKFYELVADKTNTKSVTVAEVIKQKDIPVSDSDIKSQIIAVINEYFNIHELSSYIHDRMGNIISSVTIVQSDTNKFGPIYEDSSMAKTTNIRTVDFLPDIFKTKVNSQFLAATLDTLASKPDITKISGYIGKKYGYGVKSTDTYVNEISNTRYNYQLEPSVVQLNPANGKAKDVISYPEIIDSLRGNNVNTDNPSKLFDSEYYTWDSFIDLDKLVNYGQYYWLPSGTEPVETVDLESTINGSDKYTTTEGFVLTNGVKLKIGTNLYIVEGVGTSIVLVPFNGLFVVENSASEEYIPYASTAYDESYYDALVGIAKTPDYITINRSALNKNAWSRYNRWVHVDAIRSAANFNGTDPILDSTQKQNAQLLNLDQIWTCSIWEKTVNHM